ncbi:MAG TPA: IclR family transcriptional regulator [Synergistales bacterium]|jgi:DNA-binding IclR family transcriptional regulator|nr:IclR family transcriptional regulator [Synergistales bacterium]HRV71270.1 IclR family transcriptional regulator [Thermovirgaceae bacterium]
MNSTEKVTWILKRLGEPPHEMGISQIADEMGFSRSGIHKILSTLVREKFVSQDTRSRKYMLGPALSRIAIAYRGDRSIIDVADPVMKDLLEKTGESVGLCVKEDGIPILVHKVVSNQPLRLDNQVGTVIKLNRGALGKVIAAFEAEEKIEALLQEPLEKWTEQTILDPLKLREEYRRIREKGYSISAEEVIPGILGIAAPIFDSRGECRAAITVGGPTVRLTLQIMEGFAPMVLNAASLIAENLGEKSQPISPPREAACNSSEAWNKCQKNKGEEGRQ